MIPSDTLQLSHLDDPAVRLSEWDDFVSGEKSGHVSQTTPWAVYRQKAGWRPILLSLSRQGSLRAVCLVLHRSVANLPLGGVLFVERGPVLDYDSPEAPYLLSEMLDKLSQLARRRFAVARIAPEVRRTTAWVQDLLLDKGFHRARQPVGHTATIRLDLTQSLDSLLDSMSRNRRQDVRRVEKEGAVWSFHRDDSIDSLRTMYSMYEQTILGAGKTPKSFDDVRLMHETLASFGCSFVLIVEYEGRPVASAMMVPVKKHLWGFGVSSVKGDEAVRGASVALIWEMIRWAKNQGYAEFDMQGIPDPLDPEDPVYGVYIFKRRWGGEEVHLIGEYDYTPYPFLDRILEWRLSH